LDLSCGWRSNEKEISHRRVTQQLR
jgi:hypothetical protein